MALLRRRQTELDEIVERQVLVAAVRAGDLDAVTAELARPDVDVNVVSVDGFTPLMIASQDGRVDLVEVLLEAGADARIVDPLMKATPGHKAGYRGHADVARVLCQASNLELDAQGPYNGYTALHDAVWHGHLEPARCFVQAGARLDLPRARWPDSTRHGAGVRLHRGGRSAGVRGGSKMTDPWIIGAGMTDFGKFPAVSLRALAEHAAGTALADAELAASDVELVLFANAAAGIVTGQEMIRGQISLQGAGFGGLPIVNVENACASASSAIHLARMAVLSGQYHVVLAVGAEKLTHPTDKQRAFDALATGADVGRREEFEQQLGSPSQSFFMDVYADIARRYLSRTRAPPSVTSQRLP